MPVTPYTGRLITRASLKSTISLEGFVGDKHAAQAPVDSERL